jgi:aminoglycoside 3-N-acetyltransferase
MGDSRNKIIQVLYDVAQRTGDGPLFVHSDLLIAGVFVEITFDRNQMLQRHIAVLEEAAAGRAVWMPTFNYDFPKTGAFDVRISPCQLGPLGEYFRTAVAAWRTDDPVFSVAGTKSRPELATASGRLDPFGAGSIFAELDRRRATMLFYGARFSSSATIIHYIERKSGGPPYRYDKVFRGVVSEGSHRQAVEYVYHVRPLNHTLEYDLTRVSEDLCEAGLMRRVMWKGRCVVQAIDAAVVCEFCGERLRRDPLYLLNESSRAWVEPALSRLGRRFELTDFESATDG